MNEDNWSATIDLLKRHSSTLNDFGNILNDFNMYRDAVGVVFPSNTRKQLKITAFNVIQIKEFSSKAIYIFEFSKPRSKEGLLQNISHLLDSFEDVLVDCSSKILHLVETEESKEIIGFY